MACSWQLYVKREEVLQRTIRAKTLSTKSGPYPTSLYRRTVSPHRYSRLTRPLVFSLVGTRCEIGTCREVFDSVS
jgi:hypothetical protein